MIEKKKPIGRGPRSSHHKSPRQCSMFDSVQGRGPWPRRQR